MKTTCQGIDAWASENGISLNEINSFRCDVVGSPEPEAQIETPPAADGDTPEALDIAGVHACTDPGFRNCTRTLLNSSQCCIYPLAGAAPVPPVARRRRPCREPTRGVLDLQAAARCGAKSPCLQASWPPSSLRCGRSRMRAGAPSFLHSPHSGFPTSGGSSRADVCIALGQVVVEGHAKRLTKQGRGLQRSQPGDLLSRASIRAREQDARVTQRP